MRGNNKRNCKMNPANKEIITKEQKLDNSTEWDEFVDKSVNGTIFHKKLFLSYHNENFDFELLTRKVISLIIFYFSPYFF